MDAGSFNVFSEDLEVKIALGRAQMYADELPKLRPGAVVALDKPAADPVDLLAGGRLVARGEVIVLDGKLCVRIVEVVEAEPSAT